MKNAILTTIAFGLIVASGCSSKETHLVQQPVAQQAAPTLPNDVHWFRNAAEQRAVYLQGFKLATAKLEEIARNAQPGTWAVSLDADETILDNSLYQKEISLKGESYSKETWNLWCERRIAGALPGAREFMQKIQELGGKVVIVSNRYVETQQATEDNLRTLDIPFDLVMLRQGSPDKEKERRWNEIETGTSPAGWPPLKIVMYVGDNIMDFPDLEQSIRTQPDAAFSAIGNEYIVFPNPMYGSWQGNAQD
ncbi:MAG: 5'-nucleotidase, lipoprotein e(P4) family [Sumerlaeia bacterium]